jgi:hypothetical protein
MQQHPYRKANARLHKWLLELKLLGLGPEVLILESTDAVHWCERERHWIRFYREAGNDLFNIADGGDGIDFLPEAVRRYLSKIHKGKKLSPEHARAFLAKGQQAAQTPEARARRIASLTGKPSLLRGKSIHNEASRQRISDAHRGKPKSEETKAKLRLANLGHRDSQEIRAKKSASHIGLPGPNKGKTFSAKVRAKQSAARLGRKRGPGFSAKMSKLLTGIPKSPGHCAKIALRMRDWTPSKDMLDKAKQAHRKLMESSPEFRAKALSGFSKSRNDPGVKLRRAEGNRKRLQPIKDQFIEWLNSDPAEREPATLAGFHRRWGVSEGALTKWKREILRPTPA